MRRKVLAALALASVWAGVAGQTPVRTPVARPYRSRVTVYDLKSKSTRVIYSSDDVFEAPNWSPDGKYVLVNSKGRLFRILLDTTAQGALQQLNVPDEYSCNNDKAFSPDGKMLAFSALTPSSEGSRVFLAASDGSSPRLIVPRAPSFFHGWSPDGRWLAYVAMRNGPYALYRVPAAGGEEERLTSKGSYDDGPDYAPQGRWIYFNSNRSGGWDIWRIPPDGAGPNDNRAEQVTNDELEDWFPHISPNGKWMVFLSFPKGIAGHNDRMEGVKLRLMRAPGSRLKPAQIQVLTTFFGGQGTINVNSWSPSSERFAFVSYEPIAGAPKP